jgi:hypothetical protein
MKAAVLLLVPILGSCALAAPAILGGAANALSWEKRRVLSERTEKIEDFLCTYHQAHTEGIDEYWADRCRIIREGKE